MGWSQCLRYPGQKGRAMDHPGQRLNVKAYLRQEASVGCQKVGERAYCKDQLPRGRLGVLWISRICARSCDASPAELCTPPTAVRWDPRQLRRWKTRKVCTFGLSRYGLARGCISKCNARVFPVPIGVLLASAAVRCMTLASTPFAFSVLFRGWGCVGTAVVPAVRRLL
jgi:hypothetical protein